MTKKKVHKPGSATIALNKRARHDYFIEEEIEAGLALQGWEVKSLRAGKANLGDSYVILRDGEAFLFGANFTPLSVASSHVVCDPAGHANCCSTSVNWTACTAKSTVTGTPWSHCLCTGKTPGAKSKSALPKVRKNTTNAMTSANVSGN